MNTFYDKYRDFLLFFGKGRKMVLSTSEKNKVSSRMMSIVQIDGIFYFQTDITFRKYRQIASNHNVALCIDNIQIEGICKEVGRPLQYVPFRDMFRECFKSSYESYSSLENERLFAVEPIFIERWIYKEGIPYIETFDIDAKEYNLTSYQLIVP